VGRECSVCPWKATFFDDFLLLVGECFFLSLLDCDELLDELLFMMVSGEINPVAVLADDGQVVCSMVCGGGCGLEEEPLILPTDGGTVSSIAVAVAPPLPLVASLSLPLLGGGGEQATPLVEVAVEVSVCVLGLIFKRTHCRGT